jgi:hypothetical protein
MAMVGVVTAVVVDMNVGASVETEMTAKESAVGVSVGCKGLRMLSIRLKSKLLRKYSLGGNRAGVVGSDVGSSVGRGVGSSVGRGVERGIRGGVGRIVGIGVETSARSGVESNVGRGVGMMLSKAEVSVGADVGCGEEGAQFHKECRYSGLKLLETMY